MPTSTDLNKILLKELYTLYMGAESKMLKKVANRVKKGAIDEGWNEHKFSDVQKLRKELEATITDTSKIAKSGINKGLIDAYISGVKGVNNDLGLPNSIMQEFNVPEHLQRLIMDANNLIEGTNVQILRNSMDVYRQTIADTSTGILMGTDTRRQAAQDALNRFASKGITGFVDKAGRKWELASYVDMAVRTTTAHAALQGHVDRQVALGNDLVVVSSIGTTCPICAPWQGKVLSISGKDTKYSSLESAKSAGLFHPNCKHTITAYFEGMEDIGDDIEHSIDNDPELYKATQKQRYIERQIRKYKRLEAVALTPEEELKAQKKIAQWQAIQRQHVKAYNLRRDYLREAIKSGDAAKGTAKSIIKPLEKPEITIPNLITKDMQDKANKYVSVKKWAADLTEDEKKIYKGVVKAKQNAGTSEWQAMQEAFAEFKNGKSETIPAEIKLKKTKPKVTVAGKQYSSNPVPTSHVPDANELMYYDDGGYLGGAGKKDIYADSKDNKYIFKPAQNKNGTPAEFKAYVQEAVANVQKMVEVESSVDVKAMKLGGEFGTTQPLLEIDNSFNLPSDINGHFTDGQLKALQREHVTDWLVGNFDAHYKNFIKTTDGKILGIDKEQAFKYIDSYGSKSMDYTFHPNAAYGEHEPIYNTMFKQYAKGKNNLNLNDTLEYIKRIEAVPDDVYKEAFRGYAEALHGKGPKAEDLLNKIVKKKQDLRKDYENFYTILETEKNGTYTEFKFGDKSIKKPTPKKEDVDFNSYREIGQRNRLGRDSEEINIRRDSELLDNMQAKHRDAIRKYSGHSYGSMNGYLRSGGKSNLSYKNDVEDLIEAFGKYDKPLMESTKFYRHADNDCLEFLFNEDIQGLANDLIHKNKGENLGLIKKKVVGSTFADKGFLSTAYRPGVFVEDGGVEIQMFIPKGFNNGMFIEHVSNFSTESEYLINASQKFKVIDIDYGKVVGANKNVIIKVMPIE